MKNYINKLSILVIVFGVFACTDLEEEPLGLLAPEGLFKSPKDVESAVMGTYGFIASESYFGRKLTLSLLLRGDMSDIGDRKTPGRRQQVNDFNMDTNNGMVTAIWPRSYQIIGAANAAIAGAQQLGEPADKLVPLEAEGRFARAFAYYHLVRLFGDVPYITSTIVDPAAALDIGKTPAAEIYEGIKDDLVFAKEHLPDRPLARSRAGKGTAAAYLASVHLTLGEHQQAYNEAKFVIDNKDAFDLGLEADFQTLFISSDNTNTNSKEFLLMVDFAGNLSGSYNANTDWMGPVTGPRSVLVNGNGEGWSVAVPSMDVFATWDERDYRKKVSFIDSGFVDEEWVGYDKFAPNHGSPRPHIAKYFANCGDSRGDCGFSDNNYPAMRYAEVLLIAAEALNEINGGPNTEAEGYVNQIRERARNWNGTLTTFPEDVTSGMSQADFHDLVIEERRLELAFEFKRWYDIKRLQIGEEVFTDPGSLEPHPSFDPSKDYLFPLPQDELDRNDNLKPQNTGY